MCAKNRDDHGGMEAERRVFGRNVCDAFIVIKFVGLRVYLYNCRQIVFTTPNEAERSLFTHFPIANSESFPSVSLFLFFFFVSCPFVFVFFFNARTRLQPSQCIRGLEDGWKGAGGRVRL